MARIGPPVQDVMRQIGIHEVCSRYGVSPQLCQYNGKLYLSRLAKDSAETRSFPFVELTIKTGTPIMGLLSSIASEFDDLALNWSFTSWWLVSVDAACRDSPNPTFQSLHYIVIMGDVYWRFHLRPHGIIELLIGGHSVPFTTLLPKRINRTMVLAYLASVLPPPFLNLTVYIRVNGRLLHNRLLSLVNGFFLQVAFAEDHLICQEVRYTPCDVLNVLHVAPPPTIYRRAMEYVCYVPGGMTLQRSRCLALRGDKRYLENQLHTQLGNHFLDLGNTEARFQTVHSAERELQVVFHRCKRTVVAILPDTPSGSATVLIHLYLLSYEQVGAMWVPKDISVPSMVKLLGLTELCGECGETCWILHNGDDVQTTNIKVEDGDVIMIWQLDLDESPREVSTFPNN